MICLVNKSYATYKTNNKSNTLTNNLTDTDLLVSMYGYHSAVTG